MSLGQANPYNVTILHLHEQDEEPFVDSFRLSVNKIRGYGFKDYWDLHQWSCEKPDEFWSDVSWSIDREEPMQAQLHRVFTGLGLLRDNRRERASSKSAIKVLSI